jgi:hypothetical protein
MAANAGGAFGGGEAEGPVTREEAGRELHRKSEERTQRFFLRCARLVKRHLATSGLQLDRPTRSGSSASVYLKKQGKEVGRIADHEPKTKKWEIGSKTPTLLIPGTTVSQKDVNHFISKILAQHRQ